MQKPTRPLLRFIFIILLIEFIDELIFGVREAAWPLIRADLQLSYVQVGLLLGVPSVFAGLIEPFLGILGDTWKRRVLILGGGCVFVIASLLATLSFSFLPLMLAFLLLHPASGAFVSLSQAVLMDLEPNRHEQNMARWTFAGSLGVVLGSLVLGGAALLGWGWRVPFGLVALLAAVVLILAWRAYHSAPAEQVLAQVTPHDNVLSGLVSGLRGAGQTLRRVEVLRWLILLFFSDFMLDILLSFLALYMVDAAGLPPAAGGLAVAVWTGVGLLGDFLLIPLLERVPGLAYLRVSALLELILFPVFLLSPALLVKLVALGLLGFFNAGWYSILKGRLYSSMPGQSGTVMTLDNLGSLANGLVPLLIGLLAQQFGLGPAMWVLILGPVALLVGLPWVTWATSRAQDT